MPLLLLDKEKSAELRAQLFRRGLRQGDLVGPLGMNETVLSKILNGRRSVPDGFVEQFNAAVEQVARERAIGDSKASG